MELTVRQTLEKMLYDMGIFEDDASAIVAEAIPIMQKSAGDGDIHAISWDGINTYPQMMINLWFAFTVKPVGYKWANTNKPQAWWKLALATKEQQLAEGFDIGNIKTE